MKIAIDYSWLGGTGIGRVTDEVISRVPDNISIVPLRVNKQNASLLSPCYLSRCINSSNAEIFWSPGFMPPLLRHNIPVAITIHDLTHLHYYSFFHRLYYNLIIKRIIKNVDIIFTVSNYTKSELSYWLGDNSPLIKVIHNGVDKSFNNFGGKYSLKYKYILYVGNHRKYKNIEGLIKAFAISGLKELGYCLAITGDREYGLAEMEADHNLQGFIHYLGFVREDELASIYRGAELLFFASFYEGFGLPILEAMSCGVPVLTSNCSAMPEVSGSSALLVNPKDHFQISAGMRKLCLDQNYRDVLVSRGLEHARGFSWDKAAELYWSSLQSLTR